MKTIIAGSRTITNYADVEAAVVASGFAITKVISGRATGVDKLGECWAERHGVPVSYYAADWERFGKRAGVLRNEEMGAVSEALVAVWDGVSRGTKHMIQVALRRKLLVYVHYPVAVEPAIAAKVLEA